LPTYFNLIKQIESQIQDISDSPNLESRLIVCHALELTNEALTMNLRNSIASPDPGLKKLAKIVEQRKTGMPLAYATQEAYFCKHRYHIEPGVLIPRPETELLVQSVNVYLASLDPKALKQVQVVELGFGSGCISIELGISNPEIKIEAWDMSPVALKVATINAKNLGASNVSFYRGDFFEGSVPKDTGLPVKQTRVIVSNPPYIPSRDISALETQVKDHEPREALDGGDDGLEVIRKLIGVAAEERHPLFLEVGIGQRTEIDRELLRCGASDVTWKKDLSDIDRILRVIF